MTTCWARRDCLCDDVVRSLVDECDFGEGVLLPRTELVFAPMMTR